MRAFQNNVNVVERVAYEWLSVYIYLYLYFFFLSKEVSSYKDILLCN